MVTMADNTPPATQGGTEELRQIESEAAQKRPQLAVQPLRPAMVMGTRSDGDGKKDSDSVSTKNGVSKGTLAFAAWLFAI